MDKTLLDDAQKHFTKGTDLVDSSDYVSAAQEFAGCAKVYEGLLAQVYCAQAGALESAGRFDAAQAAAEAAIRASPDSAKPRFCKGSALFKAGKLDNAKKAFDKAAVLENARALKVTYMDWAARCVAPPSNDTQEDVGPSEPKPPADNVRMEWYQNVEYVNMDIYAKNVVKEKSSVSFTPGHIKVRLARSELDDYVLEKDLAGDIAVAGCTWSVSRFKVDIRMKKAAVKKWKSLDSDAEVLSAAMRASVDSLKRKEEQEARQHGWEAVTENELKDYKEDDSSMSLFKQIYKDADEDTKRAMMKSYSESGGQVLSTNWDEVKKKKVTYTGSD